MKKTLLSAISASLMLVALLPASAVRAQDTDSFLKLGQFQKDKAFSPTISIVSWLTYTNHEGKNGTEYANRADVTLRAIRIGAKGSPYNWLSYAVELSLDRLGESPYAATKGSYSGLDVWKAFLTARLTKDELVNLHVGYYWAVVSRDYNTSPWAVSSFDKTRADWSLRYFVTGKGNGIESGVGFGGLKNWDGFGFSYRVGTFMPSAFNGSEYANPLFTGRFMFSIGDPEQSKYKFNLTGNHWNKRNGVTISFGGSTIGKVDNDVDIAFDKSQSYGSDIMASLGGFKFEGEYYKMKRTLTGVEDFDGTEWFIRTGYNIVFKRTFIEPTITYQSFEGDGDESLYKYIGDDKTLDIGVNWYLNKDKLKLGVHYVDQKGSASTNIGNYVGMGLQVRL